MVMKQYPSKDFRHFILITAVRFIKKYLKNKKSAKKVVISRNHSKRRSKRIIEENLYYCTLCGKGLISRDHTKRHMKSHAR